MRKREIYEIVGGKIAAWRDYTNSAHAKKLLGLSSAA